MNSRSHKVNYQWKRCFKSFFASSINATRWTSRSTVNFLISSRSAAFSPSAASISLSIFMNSIAASELRNFAAVALHSAFSSSVFSLITCNVNHLVIIVYDFWELPPTKLPLSAQCSWISLLFADCTGNAFRTAKIHLFFSGFSSWCSDLKQIYTSIAVTLVKMYPFFCKNWLIANFLKLNNPN